MKRVVMVRGRAEARVLPDRALVRVTVDGEGAAREDAYRLASEAAAAVDAVLDDHAAELDRMVTDALFVQPRTRWRKGESKRTGWTASRTSTVEVASFDRLGELLAELTYAGAILTGPRWRVDAGNEVHDRVRRAAAEDARKRADAYAAGLGSSVAAVSWIAEPGLRLGGGQVAEPLAFAPAPAARMAAAAEPIETIDVQPEEMVISAAVDVAFALTKA